MISPVQAVERGVSRAQFRSGVAHLYVDATSATDELHRRCFRRSREDCLSTGDPSLRGAQTGETSPPKM